MPKKVYFLFISHLYNVIEIVFMIGNRLDFEREVGMSGEKKIKNTSQTPKDKEKKRIEIVRKMH